MNPGRTTMQLITGCTSIAKTTMVVLQNGIERVSNTVYRTRTVFEALFGNKKRGLYQQVVFCVLMMLQMATPTAAEGLIKVDATFSKYAVMILALLAAFMGPLMLQKLFNKGQKHIFKKHESDTEKAESEATFLEEYFSDLKNIIYTVALIVLFVVVLFGINPGDIYSKIFS